MIVGVPTEIKDNERRVGLTPASVAELVRHDHTVLVQSGAGVGIGADDRVYEGVGAKIVAGADEVFAGADLVIKVKEPQPVERARLRPEQTLFTYLHLAPDPDQTADLLASGAIAVAYETVTDARGNLPLLAPMSKVAGRLAVQAAAHHLESAYGGAGLLLGGVPGVAPAKVVIIGGGVVGENAAQIAIGMGADVTVLDRDNSVLDRLANRFGTAVHTMYSTGHSLEAAVIDADVVIGAVLVPGAAAPELVTADMVARMRPGSVLVDVAIDQGGCFETSHPTTHSEPVFIVDGVVHYCVANMPGAVPRTSAHALNNATLPFVLALADLGTGDALRADPHLANGLNIAGGRVTEPAVAEASGYQPLSRTEAVRWL
ncbi:MAG: alanine dehydrogenase [Acidimicrobiia bacterium]|nr:alanine dehydrogenase [Acidimicrobiia bacterium]